VSDTPRLRKKIYAEATAIISFMGYDKQGLLNLTNNFLARRGIETIDSPTIRPVGKSGSLHRVHFAVKYRVHGGWRSDFIKKIDSDARDLNVEILDLLVEVTRREIPTECPRKACEPCQVAQGIFITRQLAPSEILPPAVIPVDVPEVDDKPRRRFLGGFRK
jgi:hypothetical protein